MSSPRKIALFGGTFDPVHLGHVHMAELAKRSLKLDEVRFLPCRISPHKTDQHPASGDDRAEMLRLATAHLPWAVVDEYELHQPGPSFSYQTAETMAVRFPKAQLFWILGGDQWAVLPEWKHPERLAKCVEFIIFRRGEQPLQAREGYRCHFIQTTHPASATGIRQAISNETTFHEWLHPDVSCWIAKKQLYRP